MARRALSSLLLTPAVALKLCTWTWTPRHTLPSTLVPLAPFSLPHEHGRFQVGRAFGRLGNLVGWHNGLCVGRWGTYYGMRTQSTVSGKPRSFTRTHVTYKTRAEIKSSSSGKAQGLLIGLKPPKTHPLPYRLASTQFTAAEVPGGPAHVPFLSPNAPQPSSMVLLLTIFTEVQFTCSVTCCKHDSHLLSFGECTQLCKHHPNQNCGPFHHSSRSFMPLHPSSWPFCSPWQQLIFLSLQCCLFYNFTYNESHSMSCFIPGFFPSA